MKTISEVCRLVGVTRKTLRGYDEIGLLHPTDKSENGYWLYDDDAIRTLTSIQTLVELGYTRREIKELFAKPDFDLEQECDRAIQVLQEKKARIDGMIELAQSLKRATQYPAAIQRAMQNYDLSALGQGPNFAERLDQVISSVGSEHTADPAPENRTDDEKDDAYIETFSIGIVAIASLHLQAVDSALVQDCVQTLYESVLADWIADDLEDAEEPEDITLFEEMIVDLFNDAEMCSGIEESCGEGSADFVLSAVHFYCEKKRSMSENT